MLDIGLGLVCLAAGIAVLVAMRARDGIPHPLMLRTGMEVVIPLLVLSCAVAGIGLMVNGGFELWSGS